MTWDKTESRQRGSSYLHLTKHIKILCDCYAIALKRYFGAICQDIAWLDDPTTPFFLNSAGSGFSSIDMKHIVDEIQLPLVSGTLRKYHSSWAVSHESEEIRDAEAESLQHGKDIAKKFYLLDKVSKPQMLTQVYCEEENYFPQDLVDKLEGASIEESVKDLEDKRTQVAVNRLVDDRKIYKDYLSNSRPLGNKNHLLAQDKKTFRKLMLDINPNSFHMIRKLKPQAARKLIVRMVCTPESESGNLLRKLWVNVYKGDLRYGIRDLRLSSRPRRFSRNCWIAEEFRKYVKALKESSMTTDDSHMATKESEEPDLKASTLSCNKD